MWISPIFTDFILIDEYFKFPKRGQIKRDITEITTNTDITSAQTSTRNNHFTTMTTYTNITTMATNKISQLCQILQL